MTVGEERSRITGDIWIMLKDSIKKFPTQQIWKEI